MFNKVLVATDLSEACDAAVLTAIEIAKQNNGRLHILHVLESDSTIYREFVKHFKTGEELVSYKEYEESVKEEIDKKWAGGLHAYGNYGIRVTTGFPWEEILRWAREQRVGLIVLGPHAGNGEDKNAVRVSGTLGSTVEGVIKRERCPVMIVNRSMSRKNSKFKKVMVSTDFSDSCEHAFRFAIKLSQNHSSKLFLFHMLPVPPIIEPSRAEYEMELKPLKKKKLKALCREIPIGIDHEYGLWGGARPHLEILKYADKNEVDLIVMGSHTKQKGGKWYVGSAVEKVSSRSICPVVVITDPKVLSSIDG
jgi:nucleotide-binding universal stress UspA family protein